MILDRKLEIGDIIECKGVVAEIGEIIYSDYLKTGDKLSDVNIEFYDTHGNYRSWKSDVDGGKVSLYEVDKDKFLKILQSSIFSNYYDPYTGRFYVPLKDINSNIDVLKTLLLLMNSFGYFLDLDKNGEEYSYTLFKPCNDSKGFRYIDSCKSILADACKNKGIKPFSSISYNDYISNSKAQEVIDEVLDEYMGNWTICLRMVNKVFHFVEVRDVFC